MNNTDNRSRVVLITVHCEASRLERLQSLFPDLQFHVQSTDYAGAIPDDLWQEVEILYSFASTLPSQVQAPRLRWVQLYSAGANHIVKQPLFQTPVIFTTASGVHAVTMAEYVFTVMLSWFHHFPLMLEWQQKGQWPPEAQRSSLFTPEELRGKTIGIVGYGSIGREVARLATAFGMRVLAMQQSADHRDHGFIFPGIGDPQGNLPDHYYTSDQLHAMLRESDIVLVAVPLTPKTRGMLDDAAFQAMKPTAFLINIARGDICDEAALVRALQKKQIAGAALDVFHQEPLPANSILWRLPNVYISPHITGFTSRYEERVTMIFAENLRRYQAGEPLYNIVDKERGY